MKKRLVFALILIGVTAISSQIIFVREFLTVFYGNELSVGFLLSVWLFGGAMGSFLAAALRKRSLPVSFATFSNIQVLFFFLIPTSLILTRITRIVFKISLGELVSIPTMLAWSFVCLVPTCTLLGFLFVAGCSLYESGEASSSKKIAGTYFLESIGATLGGIVTSLLLIRILSNFEIAFLIAFLNLFSAYLLARACGPNASVRRAILLILMALFVLFSLVGGIKKIDQKALELRWTGADLIKSKDSIYGNVVLAKISDEFVFFSNGLYTIGAPDRVTAEDVVHFPMLMHPDPKHILLIGGGEGEALSEILKYRGTKVTYVELDPLPIKFAKQYLKKQPWYEFDNPRVAVKNTDARHFIQATDLRFDVVIINLPNPYTAQINRFYTLEFFRTLRNVLNEKGIVSFTVLSSQNYISHELGDYLRSLYNTLKANFKDVKIIPGDSAHFLASNTEGIITLDYNRIEASRKQKNIHTDFVRPYYLFAVLSMDRICYINEIVTNSDAIEHKIFTINKDFHPISYYFDMVLWTSYQSNKLARFIRKINKDLIIKVFWIFLMVLLIFAFMTRKMTRYKHVATVFALGTTGFSEMTFQILIILGFQTIYGYLYYKIGIIFTAFMVGLALGTFCTMRLIDKVKRFYRMYINIQLAVLAYPLFLMALFYLMSKGYGPFYNIGSNIIFSCLPFIAGFIGGMQFPIANKIYLSGTDGVIRSAGITYAADLAGSCIGALMVSAFIIPLIGIYGTCIGVTLLNLVALAALLLGARKNNV